MDLYTFDRRNLLNPGVTIELFSDYNITNVELGSEVVEFINKQYPIGISEHGNQYIFEPLNEDTVTTSVFIDSMFELIRQQHYPKLWSRFQSVFAVEKKDVPKLAKTLGISDQPLYQVEAEHYEKHDMNLLKGSCYAYCSYFAHRYWRDEHTATPLFEYLLKPPIKVIRNVQYPI